MLAERLKELEVAGLLNRTVYPETPVRVEYGLTQKGAAVKSAFDEREEWANIWHFDIYSG